MHEIYVENRRKKLDSIREKYPNSVVVDVTSKAEFPWIKFSPFYPVGKIPIPFSEGCYSKTVEGLWQGLKVFESCDIDSSLFENSSMKALKRTVRKYGNVLGHRRGIAGELMGYAEARRYLYLPSYIYVLENYLVCEVNALESVLKAQDLVLLDYETNQDIENLSKPLSHASIIRSYIEDRRKRCQIKMN